MSVAVPPVTCIHTMPSPGQGLEVVSASTTAAVAAGYAVANVARNRFASWRVDTVERRTSSLATGTSCRRGSSRPRRAASPSAFSADHRSCSYSR